MSDVGEIDVPFSPGCAARAPPGIVHRTSALVAFPHAHEEEAMHTTGAARGALAAMVVTVLVAFGADRAPAQPIFDHLKCFNISDSLAAGFSLADLKPEQLPPFITQLGCKIKRPAKLFCIDVEKSNVSPTPPSTVAGQTTRDYLCYPLKCTPPLPNMPLAVEDQFGPRNIVVKQPKMFCVPAIKTAYPQPTPTPCVPPTPTVTPTPCPKQCLGGPNNGAFCTTASQCPAAACAVPMCCCAATGVPACAVNADCLPFATYCQCP